MKKKNSLDFELIRQKIIQFNLARGWNQAPEDLAKSIVLEAAELLEHYQFDTSARRLKMKVKKKNTEELGSEVADVFFYLIIFCYQAKIDLLEAVEKKLDYAAKKYPVEMFNGRHNPDFYKEQKQKYRSAKKK